MMISSSCSSSITPQSKYDVFLSFRGEDTRNNFTSHLYAALCRKKIQTFIDYELNRGDEISPSLLKAIQESQISVVVFSKGYASSRWCLEELAKILECKNIYRQIVIPVFYEVDPSHVRNQTGSFADAFEKHEQRFKDGSDKLQRWRFALREAANLSGWDSLVTRPESVLVEGIVDDILKRLNDMSPSDNEGLVGINSRVREIESLLSGGSKDVCTVGIWGIGGIGKTTLAGAVYNKICGQFEESYFFHNVREESEQSGGLNRLRRDFLSTVLGDRHVNISTPILGCTSTKKRLGHIKLLIVFDDVTDFNQIECLIGGFGCLGSQSYIIITSRDKQVLTNCRVDWIYEVKGLFDQEALKLFSWYAFRQNHPTVDFMELSNRVVTYARGIPMALKVLGSCLLDKSKEIWESAMNKLKTLPNTNIQKVLKISYDALDDEVQNIFLDIACFLKGKDKDLVRKILDASGFSTEIGISILIDKSLITISNNKITMHDLLQAMGRDIVRQEAIKDPGKRTRLWHHEDIYHILTKNKGTEAIEGISLDMSKIRDIYLQPHAFSKMHNLRFLEFFSSHHREKENKVHISDGLESVFTELRYFHWFGCPLKSLPSIIHPENLVTLDMPYSNVEQLWNGVQHLVNLNHVNLSHSTVLTCIPDLSLAPNLESLNLKGCTSLLEISSSILHLNKLVILNLKRCTSLVKPPTCIQSEFLKMLVLSGCSNLKTFPEIPCTVEELFLDETAIEDLPSSIEHLCRLVKLNLKSCSRLKSLPSSICKLKSLERLYLSGCSKLDRLPGNLGELESLKELEAERTAIREVPSSIVLLNNLGRLSFERCKGQEMDVGLLLPPLSCLHSLMKLDLTDCSITAIPDSVGLLSSLKYLHMSRNNFESIPESIRNLSKLSQLDVSYCERLRSLPELQWLRIIANNCTSLEAISGFSTPDLTTSSSNRLLSNFINCFKLNWDSLRDMVQAFLVNIQHLAASCCEEYDQGSFEILRAFICFPGIEIPEWFSFQSMGSSITFELPRGGLKYNFFGFALCIAVAFQDYENHGRGLKFGCEYKMKSHEDGNWNYAFGTLHELDYCHEGLRYIGSDHLFQFYDFVIHVRDIVELCCGNEVMINFFVKNSHFNRRGSCEVKRCGVRLIYTQDVGESGGSISSDEKNEEPHNKKLKLL